MIVRELNRSRMLALLSGNRLGRLACSRGDKPYVVPITYSHVGNYLYSFSMPGQKIDFMRANPHVCVQVDDFEAERQWKSVLVYGSFEELPDEIGWKVEREKAWSILQQHANWWEPGSLKPRERPAESGALPIFYRIAIDELTGREAVDE